MFQSRVQGVGTIVARQADPTEMSFKPAGKIYKTEILDHPTYGKQTINYDLLVTVKDYDPSSGMVKYTTWGSGMYPGYNPTPNWQTIPEVQFVAMFPEWSSIRPTSSIGRFEMDQINPPQKQIPPTPTKSTGSALPLLLGAAYLLLS